MGAAAEGCGDMESTSRISAAVLGLAAYFVLLLIPERWPALAATPGYLVYVLTVPFVVLALLALGLWGALGLLVVRMRGLPRQANHRALLSVSLLGLLLFGFAYGLSATIKGDLPSGSHLLNFESAGWKTAGSDQSTRGDITIRQKMLGDVVKNVLPGRDRLGLEDLLGPSLDTPYFAGTGRDMIYRLGMERDSMFGVDSEWLLIWLDDAGRFERFEIRTD